MRNRKSIRPAEKLALACSVIPLLMSSRFANALLPAQPLSGLWYTGIVPDPTTTNAVSILNWNPATDPNTPFNTATVPLVTRYSPTPVNPNATNTSVGVDSLAVFGSESQGTTSMLGYTPTYWQYTKQLVDFGGSAGSGNLLAPPSALVDAAHRNGVPVLGTVFLAPGVYGGTISQVNAMLVQKSDGSFPVADKMILAAQTFGFDGWFINQETEGGNSTTAAKMQQFIQYAHNKAPSIAIEWYDAMDTNGNIDYRNALDSLNQFSFEKNGTTGTGVNAKVTDSMFLNYNWSSTGLTNSANLATSLGRSPYSLYAGINVQGTGIKTNVNWAGLAPAGTGASAKVSLGLFYPNQIYNSAASGSNDTIHMQNFYTGESNFWVGANADASNTSTPVTGTTWNGIANYIAPKATNITGTFVSNFATGQGHFYAINGVNSTTAEWSNMGLQDIQPTWRWLISTTGTKLSPSIDLTKAYTGGASLNVVGSTAAANTLQLYATQIPLVASSNFRIAYSSGVANADPNLAVALTFSDGSTATLPVGNTTSSAWNTATLGLGAYAGKTLSTIGLQFDGNNSSLTNYTMNIGQLLVYNGSISTPAPVTSIAQTGGGATNSTVDGSVRLQWAGSTNAAYAYNVYQRLSTNALTWVGGTPDNAYFVPDVKRQGTSNFVNLEVETVAPDTGVSTHANVTAYVDWSRAAQTLTWEGNGSNVGGAGTWDTQGSKWNAGAGSPANQYWSNAWNDTAVFGGTGGVVTLAAPVTVGRLMFNSAGFSIVGSSTLTLAGSAPVLTVATDAAISAPVQGTAGLFKAGPGNLTLSGINTYTGTTTVNAGSLIIASSTALGSSAVNLAGGTLALNVPKNTLAISGFNTFTLNKGGNGDGPSLASGALILTDDIGNEANSAFTAKALPISATGFSTSFTYQSTAGADGMTFTIQNDPRGSVAVGAGGGALAYNGAADVAITKSGSVQFNIYSGATIGTAFGTNGALGTMKSVSPVNLANGNPMNISLNYNGVNHTLSENITDSVTNATYSSTYTNIDFSTLLGGNTGYIGFTGATGAITSTQTITNFSFSNTADIAGVTNGITAASGTSSAIRLSVSPTATAVSVGSLTVNSNATLQLQKSMSVPGTQGVLVVTSLSVAGIFDVNDTSLDLPGGSQAAISTLIRQGNIISSAALADPVHLLTVGTLLNNVNGTPVYGLISALGLFDGMNPAATDVLMKLTYYGDTNLDGRVNGTDYTQTDFGYLNALTGWSNGDFNYDGVVDGSDYSLIDNAFNRQGPPMTASMAGLPATLVAVPEPISIASFAISIAMLNLRTRRSRQDR